MAVLKSLVTLIVEGKVVEAEKSFDCADSLAESLVQRGFASRLKEAKKLKLNNFLRLTLAKLKFVRTTIRRTLRSF